MKKSLRAGAIIINSECKTALVKEHLWGFPRGGKEEGESYLAAAKREVKEETGLEEFVSIEQLGVYERYPHGIDENTPGSYPMEIHMYLFRVDHSKDLQPLDQNVKDSEWFTYEAALEKLTNQRDREFLESFEKLFNCF